MRLLSSGLLGMAVIGGLVAGAASPADARGGVAVAGRGGGGSAHRAGVVAGRGAFAGRPGHGRGMRGRFGHSDDSGGRTYGYGGYLGGGFGAYGGCGYGGYGYGGPPGPAYDPEGWPTSVGIPAPAVAPPAIYVIGPPGRAAAHRGGARPRRTATADARDVGPGGGPRLIRATR